MNQPEDLSRGVASDEDPIPMLTEVVKVPRYSNVELPSSLSEVDWSPLASRVRENVLERLMRRSAVLLETRLRETLQSVIDLHIDSLKSELRTTMDSTIKDVVSQAVDEELTRLQAEVSRRSPMNR